jgi:hypothetical protein
VDGDAGKEWFFMIRWFLVFEEFDEHAFVFIVYCSYLDQGWLHPDLLS